MPTLASARPVLHPSGREPEIQPSRATGVFSSALAVQGGAAVRRHAPITAFVAPSEEEALSQLAAMLRQLTEQAESQGQSETAILGFLCMVADEAAAAGRPKSWAARTGKSLVQVPGKLLKTTVETSHWVSAPRGLFGDKVFQARVGADIKQTDSELRFIQGIVGKLGVPENTKAYLDRELQAMIDGGRAIISDVPVAQRVPLFLSVIALASVLSMAYPYLAGEAEAKVVVNASVIISAYYGVFKMFHGTAGVRESLEFFVERYWSFVAVSLGLVWRLVPSAVTDFTRSNGWASAVTVGTAGVQTWYGAGDGIKGLYQKYRGIPALDNPQAQPLAERDRQIVQDIGRYLHAKKQHFDYLGEAAERAGVVISSTMNEHFGRYTARLDHGAVAFDRLRGERGSAVANKHYGTKAFIEAGSIAQLSAPVVLAVVLKKLFLILDSSAVGFAVAVQGLSKTLEPAVNEAGMMEWFRKLVSVPLLQTILLAVDEAKDGPIQTDPKWFDASFAMLAFSAMTVGGLLGTAFAGAAAGVVKGARAGVNLMRGPASAGDAEAAQQRHTLNELVNYLYERRDIVRRIDPRIADDVEARYRALSVEE